MYKYTSDPLVDGMSEGNTTYIPLPVACFDLRCRSLNNLCKHNYNYRTYLLSRYLGIFPILITLQYPQQCNKGNSISGYQCCSVTTKLFQFSSQFQYSYLRLFQLVLVIASLVHNVFSMYQFYYLPFIVVLFRFSSTVSQHQFQSSILVLVIYSILMVVLHSVIHTNV